MWRLLLAGRRRRGEPPSPLLAGVILLAIVTVMLGTSRDFSLKSAGGNLVIGLLVGLGAVLLLVVVLPKLRIPRRVDVARARQAMDSASKTYGGFLKSGDGLVLLKRRGHAGRLEYIGGLDARTELSFSIEGAVDGFLQVAPESVSHGFLKQFGARDIETGDREFDDAYEVRASEERIARAILDDGVRAALRPLGRRFRFLLRITPKVMTLRAERLLYDPMDLDVFLGAGIQVFDHLKLPEQDGVDIVKAKPAALSEARCEVCGSGLGEGPVVRCVKCRTPLHRDCWDYNGRCATFACGGLRYSA